MSSPNGHPAAGTEPQGSTAGGAQAAPASDASHAAAIERIRTDRHFVIATHENPDGDALGSLVSMHALLAALGKDVLTFMASSDLPLPPEYRQLELADLVHEVPADVAQRTVVALDCGNIDRTPAGALDGGAHLVNIDHHHDNTGFGTVNYVVPDASCTAEIVWQLMGELDYVPPPHIADAMYVALVTDTGRFMYENTGPAAHRMAADLIECGVDVHGVFRRLYEGAPFAKLRLLALGLADVKRYDDGELTLAVVSAEDFARAEAEQSYAEGIIDHLRAVRGTRVAGVMRELGNPQSPGRLKISLRSTDGTVDVSAIARAQGGGGHRRAAGFSSEQPVEDVIAFLRREIGAQLHGHAAPVNGDLRG
ncbi:MAG: DHH family phosphoesterase [Solirubrobacteraceae bacterium]